MHYLIVSKKGTKFILAFIVFALSLSLFAFFGTDESKWIPKKPDVLSAEEKDVLVVAKNWTLNRYNSHKEKIDFEYAIRKLDVGFRVEINPRLIGADGEYYYVVDGQMCLDLDKERKLIEAYQCAFPPFEVLQRR